MATSLPVTIDADYPDEGSPSRKTHQQHHDALHGYTNSHDTAADPHGDRAAASSALTAHTSAADPHTVYLKKAGGDTITASGPAVVPLTLVLAAGQTANGLEVRNSGGTVLVRTTNGGDVLSSGAVQAGLVSNPIALLSAYARSATERPLLVRGFAGQTANLAEFQNSSGTVLAGVNASGEMFISSVDVTGIRLLRVGAPDSAGVGFRTVRVAN